MNHSSFLDPADILATLRELNASVTKPLWLFGGVAVDFLVGRWTRPHGDIDLNTLAEYRRELAAELQGIGYHTSDSGWLTKWFQDGSDRSLEIVFLERNVDGRVVLHIRESDPVGVPGTYPLLPGYLDLERFAVLDGVRFRLSDPAGEWLARANGMDVVGGRGSDPKLEPDRRLLERLIADDELVRLRALIGRAGNPLLR